MKRADFGEKPFEEQWAWSLDEDGDGDGVWSNFESDRNFAIMEAIANRTDEDRFTENVYVAKTLEYEPSISAASILEDLSSEAYEECGKVAEGAFSATKEQESELQMLLEMALGNWLTKHKLWPTFTRLGKIETINVAEYETT